VDGSLAPAFKWFQDRRWKPFEFQIAVWRAYLKGRSGLIHSATGTGKTYAAYLGALCAAIRAPDTERGLRVLWITPLRALAADTLDALALPLQELGLAWNVETRTGDTSSATRARQSRMLPEVLVTTPESLSIMMSRPDWAAAFRSLRLVVVDEWHELMGSKRGVQTELALARLRTIQPGLQAWGVSATLGNLQEAMSALLGVERAGEGVLVEGNVDKRVVVEGLVPANISRFPWAGHLGSQMLQPVLHAIAEGGTCLLFTNTRSFAEIWYRNILDAKPEWADQIGLHHGSLDREVRDQVETGLKDGTLRAVVCTSSLDLGVDFSPVDRVFQLGSPKGVARLLQRAGRSGHRPGVPSRITCVPTHAFELVDIAAAREAMIAGRIESREGVDKPLDLLVQHMLTIGAGDGFRSEQLLKEVRGAWSYRELSDQEWLWSLEFAATGGSTLKAYPEYHRLVESDGLYRIASDAIAKRHRLNIGTIVSDASMSVQYVGGAKLGSVEESFVARLKPGDRFLFAGKALELVRVRDLTAYVKRAKSLSGTIPRWEGGRLALSGELANAIREALDRAKQGELPAPELQAIAPILQIQAKWSAIPAKEEFLIERVEDKEGHHMFFFPFEGRLVHEGLAALFAYRIARVRPITFSIACNDYGFELLSPDPAPLDEAIDEGLLSPRNVGEEIVLALNSVEMAKRQFREVARIAGLIFQGYPGSQKTNRQLQMSSGLFYDVFARFDPGNLLLHQSQKEVLDRQLEQSRMTRALSRLSESQLLVTFPRRPTPLAFPILVDRLRETLSTESMSDRIQNLALRLESEADRAAAL
jgi:ATP-dependent Lhr-like helicase